MLKRMLLAPVIAMLVSFSSAAFAADNTLGFQFRIPFQATADKNVGNVNGQSTLLTVFLDQETELGILNETVNLKDKTAAGTVTGYEVTALRISKNIASMPAPVYVGMDLGNISVACTAATTCASTMADIFGGLKLLVSKGKVSSFLGVELGYRIAKPAMPATTAIASMGGTMLNLSVGLNF